MNNKPVINIGMCVPVQSDDDNKIQYWRSPDGIKYVREKNSDGQWGEWIRIED